MAHFAEINDKNVVVRVLVVPQDQEARGQDYLSSDLGLGGTWVQTSYSGSIRKQFAGIGYSYDFGADVFVAPQPYPSWTMGTNHDWQPPISSPGGDAVWNERTQNWEKVRC